MSRWSCDTIIKISAQPSQVEPEWHVAVYVFKTISYVLENHRSMESQGRAESKAASDLKLQLNHESN